MFWGQRKCEKNVRDVENIKFNQIVLSNYLKDSLSTVCSYSELYSFNNRTSFEISSCDLEKISLGLNNPNLLTLNEIEVYILISSLYATREGFSYLKDLYSEEPLWERDISSYLYLTMFTASQGMMYTYQNGYIGRCLNEKTFNDVEKKECIISILDAEKSAIGYYSNLTYEGSIERCLEMTGIEGVYLFNIGRGFTCRKIIEYRKRLFEKIKESNLDYNQKYLIFSGLFLQDDYIGKERLDASVLHRILTERIINPKYRFSW